MPRLNMASTADASRESEIFAERSLKNACFDFQIMEIPWLIGWPWLISTAEDLLTSVAS